MTDTAHRTRPLATWQALLLDAVLIVVFAAIGRRSHAEAGTLAGVVTTAWPFLAGAAVGWAALLTPAPRRLPPESLPGGVVVLAGTVVGGMLLRAVTGAGVALTFVLVATSVLALLLLGWRLVARAVRRRA